MEDFLSHTEWEVAKKVVAGAKQRGVPFAMAGGFAASFYSGVWRNTKDLDLCIRPQDRDAMVAVATDAGLHDLYDEMPYDRAWIYRATERGVIVDLIWQLANYRGDVDDRWLDSGPEVEIYDETIRLVPPEEMIWSKIYVVQRERCDFPDILNILYSCGGLLDWKRLLGRLDGEERLLAAVVSLFAWISPGRAREIPDFVWTKLALARPAETTDRDDERIRRLDSRPWFSPVEAD